MSRILKVSIAVAVASIMTIGVLFAVVINQGTKDKDSKGEGTLGIEAGSGKVVIGNEPHLNEINETVGEMHEQFNDALGWKRYLTLDRKSFEELKGQDKHLMSLLEKVENESLKKDLDNALFFLREARFDQEAKYLKTVHRILHDLDYYINDELKNVIIWDYTHVGNGSKVPR
ncbi:hypothetical protein IMZ31_14020 [Pontibacillus sp. ALD_SL1]|uniref:hypothetical protein n=1 Tax=Pontibacillus sp. ALD_SL1 TaxID=2777185 RepID=UPI001A970FBD|nr:hypothetical protein [Pontibacillus sp. ALD_SL1]QSS99191.1 hypothetical protein IMZ31_14020 [Pontibacillus sp. ALD_SL1]